MKKYLLSALMFSALMFGQNAYFTTDPVLTPDASEVIFAFDGDLWKVKTNGGDAYRITAMQGEESNPQVSPDGKFLAFSSTQFGNKDVFVMPLNGGEIKRLTYHESQDEVETWDWNSDKIYFVSNRYNRFTEYSVSKNGGTPVRIIPQIFNTVHDIAFSPNGDEMFFNETWESKNFANRKRYKGAYNPEIQSINLKTNALKKYTNYEGKDFGTTIDKNGNIYFKSDEANGEYNLYTFKNGKKTQLTNFDTSIFFPNVSANGKKVVFRKDYQIYVYDTETGKTTKPEIRIAVNPVLNQNQNFSVKGKITSFDVSPNKNLITFVSRGRLFVSDIKGKLVKEIRTDGNEAIDEVKFLADNKSVIYTQTVKGYHNIFVKRVDDDSSPKSVTNNVWKNRNLTLNSNRTKAVFYSGKKELQLLDLKTLTTETIAKDEFWSFRGSEPRFSPDDQYVIYSPYRNFEQELMVYHIPTKISKNISKTKVSENDAVWSPDGKYIYFASDRLNPSYPFGTSQQHIYRIPLQRIDDKFKGDKFDELFAEKKEEPKVEKPDDKKKSEKTAEEKKSETKPKTAVKIEFDEDLMKRIEAVGPTFGEQQTPYVYQKEGKTYVIYLSNHQGGKYQLWKTVFEDFEEPKTEIISSKEIRDYSIIENAGQLYALVNGSIHSLNPDKNALEEISADHNFNKNLSQEFNQMFYETWASLEQNFYDEDFHGENWKKRRDQYEKYLPYVNNRSDLRLLINDLLGELNTSHFGFSSRGEEEKLQFSTKTLAPGIEFDNENPYIVERIVKKGPADLSRIDLQKGDVLTAVNGVKVDKNQNREFYFSVPANREELSLEFMRGSKTFNVKIHPSGYAKVSDLMYDEWQKNNENYVNKKSNNSITYVHMKNMGGDELNSFLEKMLRDEGDRKGLIVDLRFNTGGNVHNAVLQYLSQRPYMRWKYREGQLTIQPNVAPSSDPIVMLINEQSLSDAEVTSNGFKELNLGTLVGTETYRWIIFTTAGRLVDGSTYRLPSWGTYTLSGKNLEKTGVKPDVYVEENLVDRMKGNQPQLDKAIEIILSKRK